MSAVEERYADRYDARFGEGMLERGNEFRTGVPEYLGMTITGVGPGWCQIDVDVTEALLNPFGAAHGAVVASVIDHSLGSAVMPIIPSGTWPATLEFKVNYLAPVRVGLLRARAEVTSISKRTAVVAVECTNDERAVALALGTVALVPPKPAA